MKEFFSVNPYSNKDDLFAEDFDYDNVIYSTFKYDTPKV